MKNTKNTKSQLLDEINLLRQKVADSGVPAEDDIRVTLAESRQRTAEMAALLEGSRAILENHNFKDAAKSIFQSCKKLIGAKAGYIALLSNDGSENEIAYLDSGGMSCSVDPNAPMPIRGFREIAYRTGKTIFNNNFVKSEWVKYLPQGHVTLENVLFAPLKMDGRIVGLIGLGNKAGDFTDNDALLASAFGEFAAIALKNSRDLELLEHSEERFRSVAQSAPNAFININNQGKIVFWNRRAKEIFCYSAEEIFDKPITILMPERFRDAHREGMARLLKTGKSNVTGKTAELYGLKKDGTEFPIELSISRWETTEGKFFTGIVKDITDRKQTEEELKKHRDNLEALVKERAEALVKSEQKFREFFENTGVGMFRAKFDGSAYLDVNDKMAEIIGFKKEELIGKQSNVRFLNPKDWKHIRKQVAERGFVSDAETQIITHDGVTKTITLSIRLSDEKGVIEGSVLDITERRLAQNRVKAEQQRFNDVLDKLPVYVVLLTPDYHVSFANRFFRERFGESHGKRCFEYLFNRTEPCEICETYTVMKTLAPHRWEWTGPDGKDYDVSDFPFTDKDGTTLILEMGVDITERKIAERAIRQAYSYNRSLIEASIDPFVTIGADGKITDVNRATEESTGYSRNELIGTDFSRYFTNPSKARSAYKDVFKEGVVRNFELEIQHKDGHVTPVLYNASLYKDEVGNVVGVFASARDITKQQEAEKARKEAERKLEEQRTLSIRSDRLRSLGEMAASIAHELNQPLMGVRGLAQHMLIAENRGWDLSKQNLNEKVKLIMEQADRMSHIIEHARMFARAADQTEMIPVHINNVIQSSIDMVESHLKSRGFILDLHLSENLPMALANPYSLEEVILNLISNARDALAEKAQESAEPVKIELRSFKSKDGRGNWVIIEVRDSGKGIPEEFIDKVFDPFFTTKDMDKGTGLGLSISKKIIEEFNGKIEIESKSGVGTTVSILLPPMQPISEVNS